ncbi:hypothetical protein RFI_10116 [Reticulomyxa filosa]|uniref:Uncharacterized protein n=1 Tax=Reticulomyxa filosa TaxID=46433 RepID=X6NLY4_RETFI|nr:hypothetical protein RFI_10116 [Reticulomyxa filosa]|eukprot:ETO27016.1 hypothetical protein RFI_10116 [Reticulomyxa filosa]
MEGRPSPSLKIQKEWKNELKGILRININLKKIRDVMSIKGNTKVKLLLIGQSGSGKTTLRFAIQDYLEDKSFEEVMSTSDRETQERKNRNKIIPELTEGQSIECDIFNYYNEDFDVDIIDTPGFFDPKGKEQDNQYRKQILDFVERIEFNAVIFTIPGTWNRESKPLQDQIKHYTDNLSLDSKTNFFVVFTHTLIEPGKEILKNLEKTELHSCDHVFMDNSRYTSNFTMTPDNVNLCKTPFDKAKQQIHEILTKCSKLPLYQGKMLKDERFQYNKRKLECLQFQIIGENIKLMIRKLESTSDSIVKENRTIEELQTFQVVFKPWKLKRTDNDEVNLNCNKRDTDDIRECAVFNKLAASAFLRTAAAAGGGAIAAKAGAFGLIVAKGGGVAMAAKGALVGAIAWAGAVPTLAVGGVASIICFSYVEKYVCNKSCEHWPSEHVFSKQIPTPGLETTILPVDHSLGTETDHEVLKQKLRDSINKEITKLKDQEEELDKKLKKTYSQLQL